MRIRILLTLSFVMTAFFGMTQESTSYDKSNLSVQEEMKIMHKELNLTAEQQYQIIELLGEKRLEKEAVLSEIEKLKTALDNIDSANDKKIAGVLNEKQRNTFTEQVMPKLKEERLKLREE